MACDAELIAAVVAAEPTAGRRWEFLTLDGKPHRPWSDAESLPTLLIDQLERQRAEHGAVIDAIDRFEHPDARRIVPGWRGEPFDIHECVQALYRMRLPDHKAEAA